MVKCEPLEVVRTELTSLALASYQVRMPGCISHSWKSIFTYKIFLLEILGFLKIYFFKAEFWATICNFWVK